MKLNLLRNTAIIMSLSVFFCACAKKQVKKDKTPGQTTPTAEESIIQPEDEISEADIRGDKFTASDVIAPVLFVYDKYTLSEEARAVIQKNAEQLRNHDEWEIIVEGNCDERGTIEYNLGHGQKRAKETRDYYVRLGIRGSRIGTISYGKERPVCYEATESCWTKNRRADTKIRLRSSAAAKASNPKTQQTSSD